MLRKISEHVWYLPKEDLNHRPALGYVCCGRESMIVDTGNSPDHVSLFYGNIRSSGLPDPEYATLTHWHWDHVFGLSGSPAKSIAGRLTNEHLYNMYRLDWSDNALNQRVNAGDEIRDYADIIRREIPTRHTFKVKLADMTFSSSCNLRLGEVECHMEQVGGPHSEDSVVVFVPTDGVLFLGDCYMPNLYRARRVNIAEFAVLIDRLKKFKADQVVSAHENDMTAADFFEKMDCWLKIGEGLVGVTDAEEGHQRLTALLGRTPTPRETWIGESFIRGNRIKSE